MSVPSRTARWADRPVRFASSSRSPASDLGHVARREERIAQPQHARAERVRTAARIGLDETAERERLQDTEYGRARERKLASQIRDPAGVAVPAQQLQHREAAIEGRDDVVGPGLRRCAHAAHVVTRPQGGENHDG